MSLPPPPPLATIDLSPFLTSPTASDEDDGGVRHSSLLVPTPGRAAAAAAWDAAMASTGMAYVCGHGVPPSVTANVRAAAARFFALPTAAKEAYSNAGGYGSGSGDGYTPLGGEAVAASMMGGGGDSAPGGAPIEGATGDGGSTSGRRRRRGEVDSGGDTGSGDGDAPPPDVVESLVYTGNPSALPPPLVAPVTAYVAAITTALAALMRLSAVALGLSETALDVWAAGDTSLRLAHYPGSLSRGRRGPRTANGDGDGGGDCDGGGDGDSGSDGGVDGDRGDNAGVCDAHLAVGMRYGAHTDYVGFTLLDQQPGVDGLQRLAASAGVSAAAAAAASAAATGGLPPGGWIDVPPPSGGALTVNAGDLITLLSGGRWVSPVHRVRVPRQLPCMPLAWDDDKGAGRGARGRGGDVGRRGVPARLSLVFFTGPPAETVVRPLVGAAASKGGGGVVAGEWLAAKLCRTNVGGRGLASTQQSE